MPGQCCVAKQSPVSFTAVATPDNYEKMYADIHFNFLHARPVVVYRVMFASHLSLPNIQCGFVINFTLRHVGGGNPCGGDTLMRVTMSHAS